MILALVGPSGSGKSVISKCLECFYEVLKTPSISDEIYAKYEKIVQDTVKKLIPYPNITIGDKLVVKEVISHTTRDMRENEVHGKHYFFVTEEEFFSLERYEKTEYLGKFYGLTQKGVDETLALSEIALAVVDRKGVFNIREKTSNFRCLFVKTTLETMEEHMKIRKDAEALIEKRILGAKTSNELEFLEADYIA